MLLTITDGIEAVGAEASSHISLLPAECVHVLLVDHSHGCGPDLEAGWLSLALGSFTRLDMFDATRLAWEAAAVVARAAGLKMPPLKSDQSKSIRRR